MNLRNLVKGHVYKNDPSIKCKEGTYIYINEPRAYKELHTFHVNFSLLMDNNCCNILKISHEFSELKQKPGFRI